MVRTISLRRERRNARRIKRERFAQSNLIGKRLCRQHGATLSLSLMVARSEERRVGKSVSVRVDLGGRRIIKNKKQEHSINHTAYAPAVAYTRVQENQTTS